MSDPLAIPAELGVHLGREIDDTRADLCLRQAHARMELYISPVPSGDAAWSIELSIAARLYNNPTSAHQAGIGSAQTSYGAPNSSVGIGGIFLSKTEIRDLRRLAGRTGAFTVDLLGLDADGDGVVDPVA